MIDAIEKKRQQIAELDQQIVLLCQQRITLAEDIFKLKQVTNCPIVDAVQEREVYFRFIKSLGKNTTSDRIQNFVQSLIELSKTYPRQSKESP